MLTKSIVCALACLLIAPQEDPAKNLKSKDANTRLVALEALSKEKNAKNEKAVLGALKDEDWEVVEKAVEVLGKIGSNESLDDLVKLAQNAPLKRLRTGAGASLAQIDAKAGLEALQKKLPAVDALAKKGTGPEVGRLAQALAELAASTSVELDYSAIDKLPEKAKDPQVRAEIARALVAGTPVTKPEVLQRLALSDSADVASAALEAARRKPAVERIDPLIAALERPALADVVERRGIDALVASLTAGDSASAVTQSERVLPKLVGAGDAHVAARGVRTIAALARCDPRPLDAAKLLALLKPALAHATVSVRAEAAAALASVGGDEAWKEAQTSCSGDKDARVRRAALVALSTIYTGADAKSRGELVARLATDASAEVRLTAATMLGIKGNQDAAAPLEKAMSDADWKVQVCAAVSLGKLQTAGAVEKLAALAKSAPTWQLRAAAVEGLARTFRKDCVPGIIAAVADADPTVQKTAHAFLCTVAEKPLPPKVEVWTDWWAKNNAKIEIVERPSGPATGKPGALSDTQAPVVDFGIWRSLDVVVLDSRGDHIQTILQRLKFDHRTTIAGKVGESGLHPAAVFIANCTGEIAPADIERLQWFVLAGGRLFGSCWALQEMIAKLFPGIVDKYAQPNEVLDNVPAANCAPESPYLQGVFGAGVEPVFALIGAYLIDVLAPERCEVLIDSPRCAETWGAGTLAVLFTQGHGTIVDSVNHFEEQGFEHNTNLKTGLQRQAWAVDHMGYSLEDLRKTRDERWWEKGNQASEHVQDLLAFRLVTNVVKIERGWTQ